MSVTVDDVKKVFAPAVSAAVLDKMDPSQSMVGQGVDSLALTLLAVAVQKHFGVAIGPEQGLKLRTLNDVTAFLNAAGAKK
jgi:acyl carrier protein